MKNPRSIIVLINFRAQETNGRKLQFCEDLFKKEDYTVLVGDEDSSAEAGLRSLVIPDSEKWSDKNHVLRTLGKNPSAE